MNTLKIFGNDVSAKAVARAAGAFWGLVFITGSYSLFAGSAPGLGSKAAELASPIFYAVSTVLIYFLLRPVNQTVSLIAMLFGLAGCAISLTGTADKIGIRDLVLFGGHCLLVGYLIIRSGYIPKIIGALLMFGGVGWLTFVWSPLAKALGPYNFMPGMLGEGILILWLLIVGVSSRHYHASEAKT